MNGILDLARPELLALRRYTPGAYEPSFIRLNANESPWRLPADSTERGLNVYPPPRPDRLTRALAAHWRIPEAQLLVTRGSSEAIDLLIRGFCAAGRDGIVICPPTFDLYRVYATIQGAEVRSVPLRADFSVDTDAVIANLDPSTKIVFVCSPNNPTGTSVPREHLERLCMALQGRALLVLDEAYREFADAEDCSDLQRRFEHVVLLRTLSKCVSLAGARCGALIGAESLVGFLAGVLPPYTFPTPSIELVLTALHADSLRVANERITLIKRERKRLAEALPDLAQVRRVYPSDANFLLVETRDAAAFVETAKRAGILLRYFTDEPRMRDCVRITVGRPKDNDRLLRALAGLEIIDEP